MTFVAVCVFVKTLQRLLILATSTSILLAKAAASLVLLVVALERKYVCCT